MKEIDIDCAALRETQSSIFCGLLRAGMVTKCNLADASVLANTEAKKLLESIEYVSAHKTIANGTAMRKRAIDSAVSYCVKRLTGNTTRLPL